MRAMRRYRNLIVLGALLLVLLISRPRFLRQDEHGLHEEELSNAHNEPFVQDEWILPTEDASEGSLDNYYLVKKIGEGEQAKVYLATDRRKHEACVVKLFKLATNMHLVQHEIDIFKALRGGPNILEFIDVAIDANSTPIALVMEYIHGTPWEELQNTLSDLQVRFYAFQLLRALEYAHSVNIMHRDLKPDNFVINHETQKLRLIDWGTSEWYEPDREYDTHVTTRWWRAPEIVVKSPLYGPPSDMWSYGCILAALVFRAEPFFPGSDSVDQLVQIASVLGTPDLFTWLNDHHIVMPGSFENITDWYVKQDWRSYINTVNQERVDDHAIDLIDKILRYNPNERITASDALSHPYFDAIRHDAMTHAGVFSSTGGFSI